METPFDVSPKDPAAPNIQFGLTAIYHFCQQFGFCGWPAWYLHMCVCVCVCVTGCDHYFEVVTNSKRLKTNRSVARASERPTL